MPRFQYSSPSGDRVFVDGPEAFVAALRAHRRQAPLPVLELELDRLWHGKGRTPSADSLTTRLSGEEPALQP